MGRAMVGLCGAAVVLVTASCSSAEPDAEETAEVPQVETPDQDQVEAPTDDQEVVRLTFADDDGGFSGTLNPSDVPASIDSEVQSDEPLIAIVTLTHERAPENMWMQLTVDGRTPSGPSSRAVRSMSELQQFVVQLDAVEGVPVTVAPSGALAQAVADGTPPIRWSVDVAVAEPPDRRELLGCWFLTAGENTSDGVSTWLPKFVGSIELSDDGTSHINDDVVWDRSGRFDYSDGTLRIQDSVGELSYTVARVEHGTPPIDGEATLLLHGEERNLRAVRFGDRCDEVDETDLDPERRWTLSPEEERALPVVDPTRQVDRSHASQVCEHTSFPIDPNRSHIDESDAPPPSELYAQLPPTAGPHFVGVIPPHVSLHDEADPRLAVHNLEHGAIVMWVDPSHPDADLASVWARTLGVAGFSERMGGGGILVAPLMDNATVEEPIVITAWGQRLVCDEFDVGAADLFVTEFYGDRGSAPESSLTPYPPDAVIDTR